MPSSITHAYIAKDVYENLNNKIKEKITLDYVDDYKTYSQGPDIYYFYKMLNPFNKKGSEIRNIGRACHHERVNELFINLTNKVKKTKSINQFLFLIGLATHYNADSIIHPYINYKAKTMEKRYFSKRDAHFMLETYLDNYMINEREDINYKNFKVDTFCFTVRKNQEVIDLLNSSFLEVFGVSNMGECYFDAVDDVKYFFKNLRYDPSGYKKYFYKSINFITRRLFRDVRYLSYNFKLDSSQDYLNLDNYVWYNPSNEKIQSDDSFYDLYYQVVNKSQKMIEKLYGYIFENKLVNLENLFGNKSYGTGLPIE